MEGYRLLIEGMLVRVQPPACTYDSRAHLAPPRTHRASRDARFLSSALSSAAECPADNRNVRGAIPRWRTLIGMHPTRLRTLARFRAAVDGDRRIPTNSVRRAAIAQFSVWHLPRSFSSRRWMVFGRALEKSRGDGSSPSDRAANFPVLSSTAELLADNRTTRGATPPGRTVIEAEAVEAHGCGP